MDGNDQSDKGDQMKVEDIRLFFDQRNGDISLSCKFNAEN